MAVECLQSAYLFTVIALVATSPSAAHRQRFHFMRGNATPKEVGGFNASFFEEMLQQEISNRTGTMEGQERLLKEDTKMGFVVSVVLSREMLETFLRREVPYILEAIGFKSVVIEPSSNISVVAAGPSFTSENGTDRSGVNVSISSVTFYSESLYLKLENASVDATVVLDAPNNVIAIPTLRITPREREALEDTTYFGNAWDALLNVGSRAVSSLGNTYMDYYGLTTYQREFCWSNEHGTFDVRFVAWEVDPSGDLGVGFMVRPQGSQASLDRPPRLPIPYQEANEYFTNMGDAEDEGRFRLAFMVEDELIMRLATLNLFLAGLFHTWVHFMKSPWFHNAARAFGAHFMQDVLVETYMGGPYEKTGMKLEDHPDLKFLRDVDVETLRTPFFQTSIEEPDVGGKEVGASTVVLGFKQDHLSIVNAMFIAAERRSLLGLKREPTQQDLDDDIALIRWGLCPATN